MHREQGKLNNPLLSKYLDSDGNVDYNLLSQDAWIDDKLSEIKNIDLSTFSDNERKAFWLNAYNLLILKSVLAELSKKKEWKGVTTLWTKLRFFILQKHLVGKRKLSLNTIENRIIRKQFMDPRIHFALNCGSQSCPYLPSKLFEAEALDEYLDELTSVFINEQHGVRLEQNGLVVSRIFKWYRKDFGSNDKDILDFIKKYWKGEELENNVFLTFQDYNWKLNSKAKK